jgi:two-component system sensor histidine kinase YesM
MKKARGIQCRLVAYSLGLAVVVALSFAWLSLRSLRASIADRQEEYHTSVFRISDEYLNDYLYAMDGKLSAIGQQPIFAESLGRPVALKDFPSITARIQTMEEVLAKQFWPQNKVDELLILGRNGAGYDFNLDAEAGYLGEDFDFKALIAGNADLAALGPGKTALLYNPASGGIKLTATMSDRLLFAKRLADPDGSAGGLAVAVLSPSFLPALFAGLAEDSTLSVDDSTRHLIWASRPEGNAKGATASTVRTSYSMGSNPLRLTISTDLARIYPELGRFDPVLAVAALVCLALVTGLAPPMARKVVMPLDELARRLAEYNDKSVDDIESARALSAPGASLRSRLFIYFVLTVVLPVIGFIAMASWRSYEVIDRAVACYVTATIHQAEAYIDYNFDAYNELTSQFIYNDEFQASWPIGLAGAIPEPGREFIDGYFARLAHSRGEFFALNLYANDGRPIYTGLETEGNYLGSVLKTRMGRLDRSIGQLILIGAVKNRYKKNLLVFARKVRGLRYYQRPDLGYALFFVEPYQANQVYNMLGTSFSKYLFVIDDERNILAGFGAPSGLDDAQVGRRGGILSIDDASESWAYQMVGRIPAGEIRLMILPVILTGVYIIIAHLVIIVLLSGVFASSIMRPMRRLLASIRSTGSGQAPSESLIARFSGRSELAEIAARFNDLVLDNYRSRFRANELAVLEREAKLNALQQQINPHFMYNTLETIKWMAYRRGEREISDMASAMGKFLRGNMAMGEHFTSLAEEIEHLKSYLYIQQIRYDQRFDVQWEVAEGLMQVEVPRLILQPVVENAINHGFDEIRYKGNIKISSSRVGSGLMLMIVDNGKGMAADELARVRAGIESGKLGATDSIGLANVSARLKLTLGPMANLRVDSEEGAGTIVTILLPRGTGDESASLRQ